MLYEQGANFLYVRLSGSVSGKPFGPANHPFPPPFRIGRPFFAKGALYAPSLVAVTAKVKFLLKFCSEAIFFAVVFL